VSGVPRGLARHVGDDPPERVPVAVDRGRRKRASGSPAARDRGGRCPGWPPGSRPARRPGARAGGDGHAAFPGGVPGGPRRGGGPNQYRSVSARCWTRPRTEVPLPVRMRRSCSSDSPPAFFRHAVPGEREERQGPHRGSPESNARHGLPLSLSHCRHGNPGGQIRQTDRLHQDAQASRALADRGPGGSLARAGAQSASWPSLRSAAWGLVPEVRAAAGSQEPGDGGPVEGAVAAGSADHEVGLAADLGGAGATM